MARRTREENLEIIRQAAEKYSSKPVTSTAQTGAINAPSAMQNSRKRTREENIEIIRQAAEAYSSKPKNSTVDNSKFSSSSGKFGNAAQPAADNRARERARLEAQLNDVNNVGFNATPAEQAEAQAKRAQIEKRLKEIDESSKPNKDTSGLNAAQAGRFNELQEELASIKLPSFVPAGGPARELANRREEILAELDELDRAAGRDARSYDGLSRRTNWLKSWLNRTGASYTNAVGNMAELINREDKPIQGRDYEAENEKFADFIGQFDPKSADALRQNVPQANKNISDSFRGFSDNAYKAADTMLERSEGQLAKAKYGVSGAKSIAMDAGSTLLDIGVDRLGAAALGVPGLANMFARVYGSTAQDARLRGDDVETASLKGLKAATIEVVTEKIGGAFEGAYGKSLTSEALNAVRKKFGNVMNRLERSGVLRWMLDTVGEGGEEALADILNTTVDHMVGWDDGSMTTIEDILSQKDDILYDTFLGSLVGSLGASTNLISSRANARANAQNSAPVQTAQEAQNVQRDIPAAPKTKNARTANSGALNAALETIDAFTSAGHSAEEAMALLSPQQKAALEEHLRSMSGFGESRPTESKAISHKRDGVPISENVYRKIAPEMEKASEAYSEAEAKRTAQRKIAEQQREEIGKRRGKEKPVEFFGDVGYDGFKFDYKAVRAEGEAEYRKEAKKWYEAHPDAESIPPDSPLYDMNSYVNKYVRKKSEQAFDEYMQNEELLRPIRNSDQSSPNMKDKLAEKTQQERLREEDGRETRFDDRPEYAAAVESAKDVSGKYIGEKAVSTRKIDYKHSDEDAPPPTAFERQAARMVQESYEDTRQELKQRDAIRESVTKDATENMKRKAEAEKVRNEAMQEYVRKLEAATTPEEKAQAKAEYRKAVGLDTETTAEAKPETTEEAKGGNADVQDSRELHETGRRELQENVGVGEETAGRAVRLPRKSFTEATRGASQADFKQRAEEAGYKVIPESEYLPDEIEAANIIKKAFGDKADVYVFPAVHETTLAYHMHLKDGTTVISFARNRGGEKTPLSTIALHELGHAYIPPEIMDNAARYIRTTMRQNGFTDADFDKAREFYKDSLDFYSRDIFGKPYSELAEGSREFKRINDKVAEELVADLLANNPRALPEGVDASKLIKTVRDDFEYFGALPKGLFDSETQSKPEVKAEPGAKVEPEAEAEVSDDYEDMPFTFGNEESSTSPKYTEEQTVRWKAQLSERRDSNGVRRSYPSEAIRYAEETYGKQLSEIQENAKALTDRQTMYGSADFKAQFGEELSEIAVERVNKFKGLVDDVAHGISSMGDLYKAYDAIKDDAFLKDYYNEATAEAISKAYDSLKSADTYPTPYNVARFRWDSVRASAMVAKSFERGAQAQIDKTAFARAANENLKVLKTKKNASGKEVPTASSVLDWYWREQMSAPNVFRSVDGWKDSGGIGYQLADQAEKSFIRQTFEYAKGEDCFYGVNKAEGFEDFVEGKNKVSVDIGNMDGKVSMTEAEAVTLLKSVQTIMASGGKDRADSLSGINVGGKSYAFGKKFELNSLVGQIESQLSPAGKAYMDAFTNMLDYYSTPLKETHREVYGGDKGMYARGNYMPLQYAYADGKVRMPDIAADANLGYDSTRIMQSRGDSHSGYLRIDPAMKVAEWYMRNASDYIAYSAFSERLKALNNSTQYSPSMADVMSDHYGKNGKQWIDNYVKGVGKTRAEETTTGTDFLKSMRMKMYKGALGLSPTVPLKQWASYWSAADVVGIGNLSRAYRVKLVPAKGNSLQNSVMRSRRRGSIDRTYSDIQESTSAIDRLVKKSSTVKWLTEGIPRSDYKVLDNIYTACELAVQQENPGIDIGSEKYRGLVDDKFNLAALRTQSVYAPTISAQVQRTGSELEKMLSMFRTQQVQDLARTMKAINEYKAAAPENKAKYAKTLRNSLTGTALSALSLGVMTQVARLMLHKKKDYEDEEGNFDWGLFAKATGVDTLKSVTGLAWFGDEATSLLLSAATQGDEPYFGLSAGVISTYEDVADSFIKFCENPTAYNGKRVIGSVGTLSGVPINNVYSLLNSVVMYSMDATGKNDDNYDDVLKWLRNETGGNVKNFKVGDEELDLSRREKMAYKNTYDVQYSQLFSWMAVSSDYMKLTDEQKDAVNKAAKEYATYRAKKVIVEDRDPSAIVSHDQWQELPERQMVKYLVAKQQATALLDSDGKIDDYAAADKFLTEKYGDLSAEQKQMLNNIGGLTRLDDMYAASKQGIDSRTYQLAYKMYKALDDSNINSTQKQERLKTFISGLNLRDTQKEWLENNLQMFRVTPIDTAMYDKFVDAGLTNGKAEDLRNDFRDLEILPDHSAVTNNQKYAAIMNADYLSEDEKWKAFFAIATSSASKEAATNRALGLTYEQWLTTSKKYGKIE